MQPFPTLAPHARRVFLGRSGLTLHVYDSRGSGPPILLLHGLGDEADTWRRLLPSLATRFRVVAPDLPGFGRSDQPPRHDVPFYASVVIDLLDTLGIRQTVLVGHSLGAAIAHWTALTQPHRVSRLILIGGSLVANPQRLDRVTLMFLIPGLGERLYNQLRADPQAAYASLRPFYGDLDRLPQAERDFLFERVNERVWSDGQRRAFLAAFRALARWLPRQQRGLPARLAALGVPTLAIWGQRDVVNRVAGAYALVAAQPTTRLVVVPGAGHNVHQEQPVAVLSAIGKTLAG